MTFHCLIILCLVFPLLSINAQISSSNGGLSLIKMGGGIRTLQVAFNIKDVVHHMNATTSSLESSNSGVTPNLRPWKRHRTRHHGHIRNVHVILIIIGWGIILPIGVIIARYFKKPPLMSNEWYSLHKNCQSIGYIVGTIGWAIGIWLGNTSKQYAHKTQRILSILIFAFTTIQMLAIFWQPKKEEEKCRKWWEMYHHFLGYALLALIIANIVMGINNQVQAEKWPKWAYVVIVGVLALIALALEIFRWIKSNLHHHSIELNTGMYTFP